MVEQTSGGERERERSRDKGEGGRGTLETLSNKSWFFPAVRRDGAQHVVALSRRRTRRVRPGGRTVEDQEGGREDLGDAFNRDGSDTTVASLLVSCLLSSRYFGLVRRTYWLRGGNLAT